VVMRKRQRRGQVLAFFEGCPSCLVGLEACATAHHRARLLAISHEPRLMPHTYLKAYVKRNKHDVAGAEAICEAVRCPSVTGSAVLPPGPWGSITPQIQPSQVLPVKLRCRFETTAPDAPSGHEFCVFEFPGCEGCPKAQHTLQTVGSSEDPMKSKALRGWIAHASRPKK
jgi:hypothetical protein